MPPRKPSRCDHEKLVFSPSSHAAKAGYKRADPAKRIAATTARGSVNTQATKKSSTEEVIKRSTFPAPLVLPGDDLAWDPSQPSQSFRSWSQLKERNAITPERRTVYFTGPPDVGDGVEYLRNWSEPMVKRGGREKPVGFPKAKDVLSYLEAFYHGLPVKMLPGPKLCFTADINDEEPAPLDQAQLNGAHPDPKPSNTTSPTVWLNTHKSTTCIGIRTRATPKREFSHQLNLNDLLDAAIEILPDDAYALLMLVEHDIYEDEEDDFACGRAYGGSRIAVVSGARYNPILDGTQELERDHAWPASHCEKYVRSCVEAAGNEDEDEDMEVSDGYDEQVVDESKDGALTAIHAAVSAHSNLPSPSSTPSTAALSGLWLGRICRTASHELGHCFGFGHCVYYACSMQGTASIIEDARQPPYLCPVDLVKLLKATGADRKERYEALLGFCEGRGEVHLFAAFAAWIRRRLE